MTVAQLTHYSPNSDLFAWAYAQAYGGHYRIYDPSFGIAKDPDLPAKMRRDPIIDSALRQRQQMVAGRQWDIEPGDESPAAKIKAGMVKKLIEQIRRFDKTRYRLAEACFRGAAYESIEGGFVHMLLPGDKKVRRWWAPMATKHIDKRMLHQINVGGGRRPEGPYGSAAAQSTTPRSNLPGVNIVWEMFSTSDRQWHELTPERSRSIIANFYDLTMDTLGYGGGLMEPLYWYFFAKGIALQEGLNGLETWSRGWITAKLDGTRRSDSDKKNDDKIANAINTLENQRSRHVLAYGEDMDVKVLEGPKSGNDMVTGFISYLDSTMTRLILGSLRPTGGGGDSATGARAQAETEADTTEAMIQFDQIGAEEMMTSDLVGLVCYINQAAFNEAGVGNAANPRFVTVREKIEDPEKNARVITAASGAGVRLPLEEVHRMLGIRQPEKDEPVLEPMMGAGMGGQPLDFSGFDLGSQREKNGRAPTGAEGGVQAGEEELSAKGVDTPSVQEISLALERAIKNGDRATASITRRKLWAAMGEDTSPPDYTDQEWQEMTSASEGGGAPGGAGPFRRGAGRTFAARPTERARARVNATLEALSESGVEYSDLPMRVLAPLARAKMTGELGDITAAASRLEQFSLRRFGEWREEDHPRGEDGKWGEGGPGAATAEAEPAKVPEYGTRTAQEWADAAKAAGFEFSQPGQRQLDLSVKSDNEVTAADAVRGSIGDLLVEVAMGRSEKVQLFREAGQTVAGAAYEDVVYPGDNDEWWRGRSDDEIAAVASYTAHLSGVINDCLRGNDAACGHEAITGVTAADLGKNLRSAIDAYPEHEPIEVMRGMSFMDDADRESFLSQIQPGATLAMDGVQSATVDPNTAYDFATKRGDGVLFKISTRKAVPIRSLSRFQGEHEVLLGHGWKYRVKSVGEPETGVGILSRRVTTIEVEAIPR